MATSRSGTNLLRSILGAHPEISAPAPFEEAIQHDLPSLSPGGRRRYVRDVLICQAYSPHGLYADIDTDDVLSRLDDWTFHDLQAALYEAHADATGADRWLTKYTGAGFSQVDGLLDAHEDAQVIYLVRDPRDVALSFADTSVGPYHPYMSAGLWTLEQSVGREVLERSETDVHLVRYETLLEEPNEVVRELCSFLNVQVTDSVLSYHERDEAERMADSGHVFENLSQPIISDNYGKFRDELSRRETRIVERVAQNAMDYFGYEPVTDPQTLAAVDLADREVYEAHDETRERVYYHRRWREAPLETLRLRIWQRFVLYIYLRYTEVGR